jgi:hypothetical protein
MDTHGSLTDVPELILTRLDIANFWLDASQLDYRRLCDFVTILRCDVRPRARGRSGNAKSLEQHEPDNQRLRTCSEWPDLALTSNQAIDVFYCDRFD